MVDALFVKGCVGCWAADSKQLERRVWAMPTWGDSKDAGAKAMAKHGGVGTGQEDVAPQPQIAEPLMRKMRDSAVAD